MEDYEKHLKEESDKRKNHLTLKKAELFTMNRQTMLAHGYFVDVPEEQGGLVPTEEGGTKTCERCRTEYIVRGNLSEVWLCSTCAACIASGSDVRCPLHRAKCKPADITGAGKRWAPKPSECVTGHAAVYRSAHLVVRSVHTSSPSRQLKTSILG